MIYDRYTVRDQHYTGRDRKLWELENMVEDGTLIQLPESDSLNDIVNYCIELIDGYVAFVPTKEVDNILSMIENIIEKNSRR